MSELILMKGNEAIGEAAIRANCRYFFGYPITPQTEVLEYLARRLPEEGGAYVQAESEVSAINMVFGASAAGARVMTASSSPGISLMQEGISYIASAQLPAVIVNIMRGAPGLGGIHPSQADYNQSVKCGGHGDYKLLVLAPSSVQELIDFTILAFELAEKYRTPVVLFGDGMMGQMMEPVIMPETTNIPVERSWAATGMAGRGKPNIIHTLYLPADDLEKHVNRLFEKFRIMEQSEQRHDSLFTDDAQILLVAYGIVSRVARAAVEMAREEGIKAGLFRPISLWPFPSAALYKAASSAKLIISTEISMGQMIDDVRLAVGHRPVELFNRIGRVPTPEEILEFIKQRLREVA